MKWYCQISVNRLTGCLDFQNQEDILPAIKEYIACYNAQDNKPSFPGTDTFLFYLVVHKGRDLYYNGYNERYIFKQDELALNELPTVHMSTLDLLATECNLRYKCFVDSSIWHYYVPIKISADRKGYDFQRFEQAIKEISENSSNQLYNFSISKEFAEFNARMLKMSYIQSFHHVVSHANYISPFLFHSEGEMKKRLIIKNPPDESCVFHQYLTRYKWRILLIDDYANESLLKDVSVDNDKVLNPHGKLKIIINDLNKIEKYNIAWCRASFGGTSASQQNDLQSTDIHLDWNYEYGADKKEEPNIYIICVYTIEDAEKIIKHLRFDLILLDYLLGEHPEKARRTYSYELLRKIEEHSEFYKQSHWIGPLNKFYFMHISAFVPAISERLQEQGLVRNTSYWHIARGACPTNTPYLFLYYLYRLMGNRYNEMCFEKESNKKGHTLIDLLQQIFDSKFKNVKQKAANLFNSLLNLRNKYDIMKHDVYDEDSDRDWLHKRGSLLVYTMFPDIKCYSNAFWEHIQQLIYLIAFGTVRQWPEMWEEYVFVRDRLEKAEQAANASSSDTNRLLSDKIEDYIIQLRNQQ